MNVDFDNFSKRYIIVLRKISAKFLCELIYNNPKV